MDRQKLRSTDSLSFSSALYPVRVHPSQRCHFNVLRRAPLTRAYAPALPPPPPSHPAQNAALWHMNACLYRSAHALHGCRRIASICSSASVRGAVPDDHRRVLSDTRSTLKCSRSHSIEALRTTVLFMIKQVPEKASRLYGKLRDTNLPAPSSSNTVTHAPRKASAAMIRCRLQRPLQAPSIEGTGASGSVRGHRYRAGIESRLLNRHKDRRICVPNGFDN
jgi:hypothetical protein